MREAADQLAALAAAIPAPITARIDQAVATLVSASEAAGSEPPGVGDRAPDFELPDGFGRSVRLSDRLGRGAVVLAFYRGDWCPFCNIELRSLRAALPRFRERNASLIAVSPQLPDRSRALAETEELTFDVLSDVDQRVVRAYGLRCEVIGDARALYDDVLRFDLSEHNGDGSWTVPIPATYVIDQSRMIVAAHVDPDYRRRMAIDAIVAALDHVIDDAPNERP